MALRKAIVVGANPQDHSLDLVMVDNYSRYTGVQVQAHTASSRTGSIDLPDVQPRENKWDISKASDQEIIALVDFVGRVPIITGFIYPQISQMTSSDGKLKYSRHTSDVQTYTDGDGNMGILHPSGAHIVFGVDTEPKVKPAANADKNAKVDRNTDKKVFLQVSLAGNVATLTMTPEGTCTLELEQDLAIKCRRAGIEATDEIELTANIVKIVADVQIDGDVTTTGQIKSDGDQIAGTISQQKHKHGGVKSGGDKSDVASM